MQLTKDPQSFVLNTSYMFVLVCRVIYSEFMKINTFVIIMMCFFVHMFTFQNNQKIIENVLERKFCRKLHIGWWQQFCNSVAMHCLI